MHGEARIALSGEQIEARHRRIREVKRRAGFRVVDFLQLAALKVGNHLRPSGFAFTDYHGVSIFRRQLGLQCWAEAPEDRRRADLTEALAQTEGLLVGAAQRGDRNRVEAFRQVIEFNVAHLQVFTVDVRRCHAGQGQQAERWQCLYFFHPPRECPE